MVFDSANLPYWIFLGVGVALFLMVIVSGGGDDDIDVDADVDVDVDVDMDIDLNADTNLLEFDTDVDADGDIDADGDGDGNLGFLRILSWLGIGKAPLILLLAVDFSTWGLSGWILNTVIGDLTGQIPTKFIGSGGLVLFSSLFFSLFVGSLISRPLGKIFSSFGEDTSSERFIGCTGTVTSKKLPYLVEGKIGQADVVDSAGNLVTLSVSLPNWATIVPHRGQEVLIIDRTEHSFLGITKDSCDRDKWFNNLQNSEN